ncbi:hypothetical protein E0H75_40840 [Kribbella capetownensis]|uniref:Uncharacterized protein n=1 Tax=Kribbella capetownensis TaxID=1572659 RepID=A0A4R0IW94_9ACTN|nr:hypothetical protein [Kribbella capetownensis]TCC37487.1 hypothetical protein E0H75_40840 [Kribbella capetownensis]
MLSDWTDAGCAQLLTNAYRACQAPGRSGDRDTPIHALLNRTAVEQAATTPAGETTSTVSRYALEMALDLNTWLQSLDVRLDLWM